MNPLIIIYGLIPLVVVFFITPWFIKFLRKINLVVKDLNKKDKPLVPLSGGIIVLMGVAAGILFFVFEQTFLKIRVPVSNDDILILFVATLSIFIITLVGFLDDLLIKRSKNESSGLKQWQKPLLTLTAAVPLMVISTGFTTMNLPFIGDVNFGILYSLILIPLIVVGASNMVNMLAGFNGLETGMGIIYMGSLGLYAYVNERHVAALIGLVTFASLIAFYYYNKTPAKILPGDSLTYLLGGSIAVMAIVGNIEKAAFLVSIPFFIEFFLKLKSRFKAKSYGYYHKGKIKSFYRKIYSLPHIFTKTGKYTEKQITMFLIIIELIFSSLIWLI
ncbi:hypothetical protein K8R47_02165 [archaeon]|nr:hypothetical protein [archaeon]